VDPRIADCRGSLRIGGGQRLSVTGSLVSGETAILLLAGPTTAEQVSRWRLELATKYGDAPVRTEHGQQSWQWIRRQRMIRLTSRTEAGERVASVSLVDGPLLDNLDTGPRPASGPTP
jgi:hypothetical protein